MACSATALIEEVVMTDDSTGSATRRGVLKTGALGLGSLGGAMALGGVSASAATASGLGTTAAGVAGVAAAAASSPADYFLLLDGIPGDSRDDRHAGWIDVLSYAWSASNSSTISGGGGGGAGKSTIGALSFSTEVGSASTPLFLQTMTGRHLKTATLDGVRLGERSDTFIKLELRDVIVTAYNTSGGGATGIDGFSLLFNRITYSYFPQDDRGGVLPPIVATWDVRAGRPF